MDGIEDDDQRTDNDTVLGQWPPVLILLYALYWPQSFQKAWCHCTWSMAIQKYQNHYQCEIFIFLKFQAARKGTWELLFSFLFGLWSHTQTTWTGERQMFMLAFVLEGVVIGLFHNSWIKIYHVILTQVKLFVSLLKYSSNF